MKPRDDWIGPVVLEMILKQLQRIFCRKGCDSFNLIFCTQICFVSDLVRFWRCCWCIFFITSPMEKDVALHLNKLDSPYQRILCAELVWNWLIGSGEEVKMWKVYRQINKRQQAIRTALFIFLLRWAKSALMTFSYPNWLCQFQTDFEQSILV